MKIPKEILNEIHKNIDRRISEIKIERELKINYVKELDLKIEVLRDIKNNVIR